MKQYNPKDVIFIFKGRQIKDFVPGSFITASRNQDMFGDPHIGVNGSGTRIKSNDRSGTVTIRISSSSDDNDTLSAFALLDEKSSAGSGPLLSKDLSGKTIISAEVAYLKKFADAEFSNEVTEREWVFATDNLEMYVGGNNNV